ncbi:MAG: hypothetical protein KGM99_12255 [Burkholderiales bacterium]|nr:hypothetical protein [Burkholderiales bacterium]
MSTIREKLAEAYADFQFSTVTVRRILNEHDAIERADFFATLNAEEKYHLESVGIDVPEAFDATPDTFHFAPASDSVDINQIIDAIHAH